MWLKRRRFDSNNIALGKKQRLIVICIQHMARLPGTDVLWDEHVAHGHCGLLAHGGLGQGPRKRERYEQRRVRVLHLPTREGDSEEGVRGGGVYGIRAVSLAPSNGILSTAPNSRQRPVSP